MKNIYLLLAMVSVSAWAQTNRHTLDNIVEAEKKSAAKIMNLVVNPNTWNYDITYHRLKFTVDPAVAFITGEVTTKYIAKENMNSITFDLSEQLSVSSVKRHGVDIAFAQNANDELVITLPQTQNMGVLDSLTVNYSGVPSGTGFGSFVNDMHNGTPVMWTLSEPFGARDWWPCKQDLNDKVDQGIDVYITAPSQYNAVSNGLQLSATTAAGQKTTHYRHTYAIPAYLIAIAVTNYQIYNQQGGLGTPESPFFPIIHYSYPENANAIQNSVSVTPGIINFYESKFGNYPFRNEKYGHCQFDWGGGMEHTTVSFMTAGGSGGYSRSLIAHEMGHQWFGDKVTCGSWRDIWLNEGFATYLATLVIEHFDGDDAFTEEKGGMIDFITDSPNGAIYLTESEALNVGRIFSSRLTYNKGAMVLNMLRFRMGDTAFFQGLQDYLNDPAHAYGYALTPDLQSHLEATSGTDLTEFFEDWVYNEGYPTYAINAHNTAPGHATITINQSQSNNSVDFFEGPVPIRLYGTGGQQTDIVLNNTADNQIFNIDVPFVITDVLFNPKNDIISRDSQAILGTSGFDPSTAISLYPNPAANKLSLDLPSGVLVERTIFYNALGQQTKATTGETNWDVSNWASGVYFLNVQTNSGARQLKFIKK
jgi:aminopeptidase N